MPFPSCCEASPARPRRGSSSPRAWVAGFSSGMPVAEDMIYDGVVGDFGVYEYNTLDGEEQEDLVAFGL